MGWQILAFFGAASNYMCKKIGASNGAVFNYMCFKIGLPARARFCGITLHNAAQPARRGLVSRDARNGLRMRVTPVFRLLRHQYPALARASPRASGCDVQGLDVVQVSTGLYRPV